MMMMMMMIAKAHPHHIENLKFGKFCSFFPSRKTQKLTFNKTNTNNFLLGTDVERVRDGVRNVRDRFVRRGVRKGDLCESALRAGVERSVFE